jgi:phosphoribosylaminoimidazole-succinocarboxamide synthase
MTLGYSQLNSLKLLHKGKVRDIYDIDENSMLMVTTDRISAFDVIMNEPIPLKGQILNDISKFWFNKLEKIVPNHILKKDPLDFVDSSEKDQIKNRSVVVKKLKPIPIEAIVRGYLIGSAWKEYKDQQSICSINLPQGLQLSEKLPEPIFTPSSKADLGEHDENISLLECEDLIGKKISEELNRISILLYESAYIYAYSKGIIIADTKFEFGLDNENKIHIMDEILTPDSSRFWPKESYQIGISPPSYDKQFVRDWLESTDWNKNFPPPKLPKNIISKTSEKYQDVFFKLTEKNNL